MANPLLVAAAIIVPVVVIGAGGGYWYYKADRVVDEGEAGPYAWRVQRVDMKYIAEVRSPPRPGFATEEFKPVPAPPGSVLPVELWDTPEAAKAKALEFIAISAAAQPASVSPIDPSVSAESSEPAGASFQEAPVSEEMEPPPTLTIAAVSSGVSFVGGI